MATSAPSLVIRPHRGPQTRFLRSNADIALFGGAASGGKTYMLLVDPLRYVHVRNFEAVIFRRTSEQIRQSGGLWDEATNLYPLVGGVGREMRLDWRWPTGSTIRFEQLQYEQTKYEYQGAQIAAIAFDELTHFTESQFFYMLSRNRSTCGVRPRIRATCNPDAMSWVAQFISWWIDQDTGFAIPERSGVKRWFYRDGDDIHWGGSPGDLVARFPEAEPLSVTFVPARLDDNPSSDPAYRSRLMSLPRIERERLLNGNWKIAEKSVIDQRSIVRYSLNGEMMSVAIGGKSLIASPAQCRRFATIDTAGTSRELAEEKSGKSPSWSVTAIWDYCHSEDVLFLRHVWRDRVGWVDLKTRVPEVLKTWSVSKAVVENAHHGPALAAELRIAGVATELVGPVIGGMTESHRGAKLERAIASGFLSRLEDGRLCVPCDGIPWAKEYFNELVGWGGMPNETADQIDVSSYACHAVKRIVASWGGVIPRKGLQRA